MEKTTRPTVTLVWQDVIIKNLSMEFVQQQIFFLHKILLEMKIKQKKKKKEKRKIKINCWTCTMKRLVKIKVQIMFKISLIIFNSKIPLLRRLKSKIQYKVLLARTAVQAVLLFINLFVDLTIKTTEILALLSAETSK